MIDIVKGGRSNSMTLTTVNTLLFGLSINFHVFFYPVQRQSISIVRKSVVNNISTHSQLCLSVRSGINVFILDKKNIKLNKTYDY